MQQPSSESERGQLYFHLSKLITTYTHWWTISAISVPYSLVITLEGTVLSYFKKTEKEKTPPFLPTKEDLWTGILNFAKTFFQIALRKNNTEQILKYDTIMACYNHQYSPSTFYIHTIRELFFV